MSETQLSNYELMVIFTPILNEEGYKKAMKEIQTFVKDEGGKIIHDNPWGLKQLAYPIQKKTTGLYWVLEFELDPMTIKKMNIMLSRNEDVLRSMVTVLDKHAVEYNAKKRNKAANLSAEVVASDEEE